MKNIFGEIPILGNPGKRVSKTVPIGMDETEVAVFADGEVVPLIAAVSRSWANCPTACWIQTEEGSYELFA